MMFFMDNDISSFGSEISENGGRALTAKWTAEVCAESPTNPESKKLQKETHKELIHFAKYGEGYTVAGETRKTLDAGVYYIQFMDNGKPLYVPRNINSDEWLNFRDDIVSNLFNEIETFWGKKDVFKKYGFLHRRGMLLHGLPGGGKTVIVKQIMTRLIESGGICFYCDSSPSLITRGLDFFRAIEPERPVVIVFEDVDAIIRSYGESDLLSFLDGEDTHENLLVLATTNYPERLDPRIICRPRRFDRVIEIGLPDMDVRRQYFIYKLGLDDNAELERWVKATEKFTFAGLTELVISVKCLGVEFNLAVEKIRNLLDQKHKPDSESYNKKESMGFSGGVGFNCK
jgi:hypothetical protein